MGAGGIDVLLCRYPAGRGGWRDVALGIVIMPSLCVVVLLVIVAGVAGVVPGHAVAAVWG